MDKEQLSIRRMFLPDKSANSLSIAYAARSGSGKTHHLTYMVKGAKRDAAFKETRFLYASIKQESYFADAEPVESVAEALKSMTKERVTVFYPTEPQFYQTDNDELIEGTFTLKENNPESSFVLIIDDANILRGFDSRGQPSQAVRKLVVAGRSFQIKGCFVCHRLANLPRLMNGNLSGVVVMNISPMDTDYGRKVLGVDLENELDSLFDYRWLWLDLIQEQIVHYNPVPKEL